MCYLIAKGKKQRRYFTTSEAARILGLKSREWVHRLVDQGHLPDEYSLHLHSNLENYRLFPDHYVYALRIMREKYPPVSGRRWEFPADEYKALIEDIKRGAYVIEVPEGIQDIPVSETSLVSTSAA